jgi:AcrR family transcriptional regulator
VPVSTPSEAATGARERILAAAECLFASRGFAATTTKAIAEEAGVATGLVFYYFASKQELLERLIAERSFAPELEQILAAADPADPGATLRTVGRRFHDLLQRRADLARILLQTVSGGGEPAARLRGFVDTEAGILADHLARGLDGLSPVQARAMALALMCTVIFSTLFLPPPGDPGEFVDATVDVLLRGFGPGTATS